MVTGKFEFMSIDADEDEHSIEMQLPYIAKVMEPARGNFTIVPVMVGSLSPSSEAKYGKIFAKYLKVLIIIVKPKSEVPKSKVPKSAPKGLGLTLKSHGPPTPPHPTHPTHP